MCPQWLGSLALVGNERTGCWCDQRKAVLAEMHPSQWRDERRPKGSCTKAPACSRPLSLWGAPRSVLSPALDTWKSPKILKLEGEQAVLQRKSSDSWTRVHQQLPLQFKLDPEAPVSPWWSKSTNCHQLWQPRDWSGPKETARGNSGEC